MPSALLVGYPNVGKSSLFNALTGLHQKTANFPGVTVEKKTGTLYSENRQLNVVDLPGIVTRQPLSLDEKVTLEYLSKKEDDVIVFVANISQLERQLPLLISLMDMNNPFILFLNMADEAFRYQCQLDSKELSQRLGIPVITGSATRGRGLKELKELLLSQKFWKRSFRTLWSLKGYEKTIQTLLLEYNQKAPLALSRYEVTELLLSPHREAPAHLEGLHTQLLDSIPEPSISNLTRSSILLGSSKVLNEIYSVCYTPKKGLFSYLESLLIHPVWGIVIFFTLMSFIFYSLFKFSATPMNLIDTFFTSISHFLSAHLSNNWFKNLILEGVIPGINGVFIFLPQILILHFFIGLLQDTGYMARISYLTDGLFSKVGLSGKSFFPLFSAHACAIPGILATRNIEDSKERLLCILITPLMSCPARLPVYSIMISLICSDQSYLAQTFLLLLMYFLPILVAILVTFLLKQKLSPSSSSFFLLELPPYRFPLLKNLIIRLVHRSFLFIKKAGTIIFALSLALWFLMSFPKVNEKTSIQHSYAGQLGHIIEPAIKPLGYDWRVGIGLIGSFAAREVFVSTMGVVFNVEDPENEEGVFQSFQQARLPSGSPLFNPLMCLSLMIFFAFAMQCLSTFCIVIRETNSFFWALFQLLYMNALAYFLALFVYQFGRFLFPSLLLG